MKKAALGLIILSIMIAGVPASATLIDCGGGMIYSTDLDITWLQDANYARTSGYDSDGLMTWEDANDWAANLSYGGYEDWRLPTFDPDYNRGTSTVQSEMAYLRFVELGPDYGAPSAFDPSPFINLGNGNTDLFYWSGSFADPFSAWRFDFW